MKVCKSLNWLNFEGGFVPHNKRNEKNGYSSSIDSFADCIYGKKIPITEYINKIKASFAVFNMPAVVSCHGWKLAEYLALGKAIISLPLVNDLPEPLIHGVNIHFVENNKESIVAALEKLHTDTEYRKKLEKGAREYWERWGTPESVIRQIISNF